MQAESPRVASSAPAVFLFGFERSGTTLLSMMVGAHPAIAVPLSTTGLWYRYWVRRKEYGELKRKEDVERLVHDLLAEERIRLWDARLNIREVLDELPPGSFPAVVERFHSLYARAQGKPRWGNIDIATLDHMDIASQWFPNARFVHLVRDGRDVALSHKTMPYGASNPLECAERWAHRVTVNLKMGSILGRQRYLVVRYEDLILDTEATLRRLCSFIGVEYSPAMLEYPEAVSRKIPPERRWLWPVLDRAPVTSKAFRWKQEMSRSQRVVFEGVAGELLKELGYESFPVIPKLASAYLLELCYFLDRGGRLRRFRERLGLRRLSRLERDWRRKQRARGDYASIQAATFDALVHQGIYSPGFDHSEPAKRFFKETLDYVSGKLPRDGPLNVLECGCGPGAWLAVVAGEWRRRRELALHGFDLSSQMVRAAREKLRGLVPGERLRQGDVLDPESYESDASGAKYDLIYAYDLIQQLPRSLHLRACQVMLEKVRPGGMVLIFDHDARCWYGRKMAVKKFLTRYLGLPLVPRFYCNARYPALGKLARVIARDRGLRAEVKVAPDGRKRALVLGPV